MKQITVSTEEWLALSSVVSCDLAVLQKGDKPISVRSAQYGAHLYTAFSCLFGEYGGPMPSRIDAYKLLPIDLYSGKTTTVYHDKGAIAAGLRDRGDMTGLIVTAARRRMVCAELVFFYMGLPVSAPLSAEQARQHEEVARLSGWRALKFPGLSPEWFSYGGHPVSVYCREGGWAHRHACLLWSAGGAVKEFSLHSSVPLSPPLGALRVDGSSLAARQMTLF